jgi:hypothetical protein
VNAKKAYDSSRGADFSNQFLLPVKRNNITAKQELPGLLLLFSALTSSSVQGCLLLRTALTQKLLSTPFLQGPEYSRSETAWCWKQCRAALMVL